ncbi:hypothetical protein B7486_15800 [cyanobacterium TDX16]|nr:hypothetical protein B7486_15800 [cyanobacterium TDX16]
MVASDFNHWTLVPSSFPSGGRTNFDNQPASALAGREENKRWMIAIRWLKPPATIVGPPGRARNW